MFLLILISTVNAIEYCEGKCCLPTPNYQYNDELVIKAFDKAKELLRANYSLQDLFHGHLITPTGLTGRVSNSLLLIHAFEYPNDTGYWLGWCQEGSTVSSHNAFYRSRNILFDLSQGHVNSYRMLPCFNAFCTRYAEEFGTETYQVFYMPPFINTLYAQTISTCVK